MAEFLGGSGRTKKDGVTQQLDADGVPVVVEYNHDNLAHKYRMQREEMEQKDIARQIRQIDDNIRRIDETIARLEGDRNPSPMMGQLITAREENVRKKVEMTNGSQVQDANVTYESIDEMRKEVQERHAKGEATDAELLATGDSDFGSPSKRPQHHATYYYEELFDDQADGSTVLTFPDDVIRIMGLNEGDNLAISAVEGNLVIKKL